MMGTICYIGSIRTFMFVFTMAKIILLMTFVGSDLQRRAKLKAPAPTVPMELRVEKALDGIYVCCFDRDPIEEEDEELLVAMLNAVFPTVERSEIERIIKDKAKKVAEGGADEEFYTKAKPLSKEAIQLQMKDLQFLKQNSIESLEKKIETLG